MLRFPLQNKLLFNLDWTDSDKPKAMSVQILDALPDDLTSAEQMAAGKGRLGRVIEFLEMVDLT